MLAVAGGKGGVGKTTTALGLARALAGRRRRPIVVDTDADMPDLHVRAGVAPEGGVEALAAGRPVRVATVGSDRLPGVSVCPAAPGAPVGRALRALDAGREPVVLDCPGGAGPDAATPLRYASRALVVATPDEAAVRDANKTIAMARSLDATVVGTVVVRDAGDRDWPAGALDATVLARVPSARDPLEADAVRAAYARLASALETGEPFCGPTTKGG